MQCAQAKMQFGGITALVVSQATIMCYQHSNEHDSKQVSTHPHDVGRHILQQESKRAHHNY